MVTEPRLQPTGAWPIPVKLSMGSSYAPARKILVNAPQDGSEEGAVATPDWPWL